MQSAPTISIEDSSPEGRPETILFLMASRTIISGTSSSGTGDDRDVVSLHSLSCSD